MATPTSLPTRHPFEGVGPMPVDDETELRNPALLQAQANRSHWVIVVVLPLALLAVIAVWLFVILQKLEGAPSADELFDLLGKSLWEVVANDPWQLVGLVAGSAIGSIGFMRVARQRLFIGQAGFRHFSGLPGWLSVVSSDWSISLDAVRNMYVEYTRIESPKMLNLVIETGDATRRLAVFDWVDPESHQPEAFKPLRRTRPDPTEVAHLFDTLPLVRYARERGFAIEIPETQERRTFDFRERPRTTIAIAAALALFAYAAIDMGLISETYAARIPVWLIVASGVFAGFGVWHLIGSREESQLIRAGVASLMAVASMLALYPGLIRINRVGAADSRPHAYRHTELDLLEPVEPSSPRIDLPGLVERLEGSEPGDVHELWIRRGSLGFEQIDIEALDDWIEELAANSKPTR